MLFDDILSQIGEFGVYQIVVYFVLGLTGLLNGWNNMAVTFTGAKMDHWCDVPALSNLTFELQKQIAAPPDEQNQQTYSQCFRYDLDYNSFNMSDFVNWNRTSMVNGSTPLVRCESWVYDQSVFVSTIRSKWNLVCQRDFFVQVVQTTFMAGFLVGSAIFGQLSDFIGRLKTLVAAIIVQVVFCLAGTFTPIFWTYCLFRFFVGVGVAGGFTIYTVLVMEIIGRRYRVVTGIMAHDFFTLGMLTISGFSWAIRDSAKLELLISILSLVLLLIVMVAPESPRWLVSVNRDEDAKRILEKIATINGTKLPEELHLEDNRETSDPTAKKPSVIDLMKGSYIRLVTLNMWFCWFVTSTVYYGLSLGVSFLQGSIFMNNTISGLVQIPAHIITAIALEKLGRRWPLVIAYLLTGVFSVACIPLVGNTSYNWLFTTFLMLGKACGAGTFALIYVYAAELFPTGLRNVGVGSSSTVARIGGLLQPQIALSEKLWRPLPFLLYGVLSLIVAVIAFFLPETKGRDLPETLEDMKRLRKQKGKKDPEKEVQPATLAGIDSGGNINKGFEKDETKKEDNKKAPVTKQNEDIEICHF